MAGRHNFHSFDRPDVQANRESPQGQWPRNHQYRPEHAPRYSSYTHHRQSSAYPSASYSHPWPQRPQQQNAAVPMQNNSSGFRAPGFPPGVWGRDKGPSHVQNSNGLQPRQLTPPPGFLLSPWQGSNQPVEFPHATSGSRFPNTSAPPPPLPPPPPHGSFNPRVPPPVPSMFTHPPPFHVPPPNVKAEEPIHDEGVAQQFTPSLPGSDHSTLCQASNMQLFQTKKAPFSKTVIPSSASVKLPQYAETSVKDVDKKLDCTPAETLKAQQRIATFLKYKGVDKRLKKDTPPSKQQNVSIPQVKVELLSMQQKIQQLEHLCAKGESESLSDEEKETAKKLQMEISEIKARFEEEQLIEKTKAKMVLIQKRRARLKRKRKKAYERKLEMQARRQKKHEEIDTWLKEEEKKESTKKKELELKAVADRTLAEVRRKIIEAKKSLDLVNALERFRIAKKTIHLGQGGRVSAMHDSLFTERVGEMKLLMQQQLETYEAEENALKVMLETENRDEIVDSDNKDKESAAKKSGFPQKLKSYLFGDNDPCPGDLLYPFHQYYTAAEENFDTFLQIRSQWDMYLSNENSPACGSIPPRWVEPSDPSSEEWRQSLKQTDKNSRIKNLPQISS